MSSTGAALAPLGSASVAATASADSRGPRPPTRERLARGRGAYASTGTANTSSTNQTTIALAKYVTLFLGGAAYEILHENKVTISCAAR